MIFALSSWAVAAGCIVLSAVRLRRVTQLVQDSPDRVLEHRSFTAERADELCVRAQGEVQDLVREVTSAPSRANAIAAINEKLFEVATTLDRGADLPKAAARIALASGTLFALLELAGGLSRGQVSWGPGLVAFMGGLAAAGVCAELGRLAKAQERRCRDAWNRFAKRLASLAESAD